LYKHRGATAAPFALVLVWGARPEPVSALAGVVLILAGEALRLWAVIHIGPHSRGSSFRAPSLVRSGPYALVRHPLYIGNALLCAGLLLVSRAFVPWFPILFSTFFVIQYALFIRSEERFLGKRWGDDWGAYAHSVGSLVPRLPLSAGCGGSSRLTMEALRLEWPTMRTTLGLMLLIALKLLMAGTGRTGSSS
jgi:protein-S-isoprenylcysteine O-methyltransferase Ste14